MSEMGITVGRVEQTMDALADVMADQKEIDDSIAQGQADIASAAGATIDGEDLEKELDALLAQQMDEELEKLDLSLPQVPAGELASRVQKKDEENDRQKVLQPIME
jgi:hypothetical protein